MYSFCRDQSHKEICVLNPSTSVGGTTDPVDNWDLFSIFPDLLRICWLGTFLPTHPDDALCLLDRVLPAHSTTLLKPLFLTRLDEAFRSIIDGNVMSRELEENRSEFEFGGFSVVVPNIATRALIEN